MKTDIKKAVLLTLACAFIMSIATVAAKQVQLSISISTLLFWQSLICTFLLLPQVIKSKIYRPSKVWGLLVLRSFGGFLALLCYYTALNHIPLVEASILRTCAPLCVPFVVLALHKKGIAHRRWLPLFIGFLGVLIIMRPSPTNINIWHLVGFTSAIGLAISMVSTRMLSHHVSAKEALFVYFFFSSVFSLGLVLAKGDAIVVNQASWLWVLVVSISLYFGMYLYTLAYTYAPASVIAPVSYIGIAFNALWGWYIWHHIPDIYAWLGAVFIILSIVITAKITKN
ncbi:DMT family transporter [Pseudocolwellia sp. HL-MZ19]|uniref:DMT family transporter n=1 Tax=unclassified Pseudocolwellia TaxID=2848178 RepID=UPI003CF5F03C